MAASLFRSSLTRGFSSHAGSSQSPGKHLGYFDWDGGVNDCVRLAHRRPAASLVPARACTVDASPLFPPPAVYLVFGATGGVGSALSETLAAQPGAQLLLSGRDEGKLQAVSSRAAAAGAAAVAVAPADPLDLAAVEGVVQEAVKRFGRVDGVASCVGSVILKSGEGRMGDGDRQCKKDDALIKASQPASLVLPPPRSRRPAARPAPARALCPPQPTPRPRANSWTPSASTC